MGGLFPTSIMAGGMKAAGWFDSSRPKHTAFDKLEARGAKMNAKQRAEFLSREAAKGAPQGQLAADTPLSSRYT